MHLISITYACGHFIRDSSRCEAICEAFDNTSCITAAVLRTVLCFVQQVFPLCSYQSPQRGRATHPVPPWNVRSQSSFSSAGAQTDLPTRRPSGFNDYRKDAKESQVRTMQGS